MNGKWPAEPDTAQVVMVEFSDAVMVETLKKQVAEAWSHRTPFSHEAIVMDMDPFLHWMIPNFIQSPDFLEGLQKELMNLDFHEKYNGLYKVQQGCLLFFCLFVLLYFKFWGTCAEHAGLLHRYARAMVVGCIQHPII
uniref:Uncharacterized protein n=1 Tax=Cebus imitator TaxID=2715852 RepID=A0A2K5RDU5_CEBIM